MMHETTPDNDPIGQAHKLFDEAFQAGILAAESDDLNFSDDPSRERANSPHAAGSFADTWWTRGYIYQARLMRAIADHGNGDYPEPPPPKITDRPMKQRGF